MTTFRRHCATDSTLSWSINDAEMQPDHQMRQSSAPVPEQFQKPLGAVLSVGVDVSAKGVPGTSWRVHPVPGGHLCLRLP